MLKFIFFLLYCFSMVAAEQKKSKIIPLLEHPCIEFPLSLFQDHTIILENRPKIKIYCSLFYNRRAFEDPNGWRVFFTEFQKYATKDTKFLVEEILDFENPERKDQKTTQDVAFIMDYSFFTDPRIEKKKKNRLKGPEHYEENKNCIGDLIDQEKKHCEIHQAITEKKCLDLKTEDKLLCFSIYLALDLLNNSLPESKNQ